MSTQNATLLAITVGLVVACIVFVVCSTLTRRAAYKPSDIRIVQSGYFVILPGAQTATITLVATNPATSIVDFDHKRHVNMRLVNATTIECQRLKGYDGTPVTFRVTEYYPEVSK